MALEERFLNVMTMEHIQLIIITYKQDMKLRQSYAFAQLQQPLVIPIQFAEFRHDSNENGTSWRFRAGHDRS